MQAGVLAERVALITGASRGIGRGIAVGLAQAGASVALVGREAATLEATARELSAWAPRVLALPADVAEVERLPDLVAATVEQFGRLDILVTAAGGILRQPAVTVTETDWDALMGVNLKAMFFSCQAAARVMIPQGGGKIINIASLGSTVGNSSSVVYGASKGGVAQLTKSLALEWAPHNIQVNAIGPGFITTDMTGPLFADAERHRRILEHIPMNRLGTPADLAGAAVFLAAPASDYVTGQVLYVDGGYLTV